jgi:hypothetical protein
MLSQYRKKVGDHGVLHAQPVSAMRDMWAKVAVCGEEEPGAGDGLASCLSTRDR